ncbi:MAG: hypothetical protein QE263_06710 [Vampirovibrionales bacterium]|nr:hypothetical protein [Vampirovibrionales bacterium]
MPINTIKSAAFQSYLLKKYDENHTKQVQEHKKNWGWFGSMIMRMDTRYDVRFDFQGFKQCWQEFNINDPSISDDALRTAFEGIDSPGKTTWHDPDGHYDDGFLSREEIVDMLTQKS